ncbi:MAG TPA: DHH family phosphoesterase [Candidatus Marinimicrobia bacterium]|jgi:phosphoesterase RecJ-like protein|nr:DHH family phosphoesterase [Candidatus Neomarinimicrobiota bacterium]
MGSLKNNMNFNNTSIDWYQVHEVISAADRIMLSTHENPDGDGLGAECGLYYHLKEIGKDVRIINYSPLPEYYTFLNSDQIFECYDQNFHENWIKDVNLVIIFDVGNFVRTRTIVNAIKSHGLKTLNIDHHPHPDEHPFTHNVVDLSAAATGCMVYDYLQIARTDPIAKKSLEGIYTAVMTDTGCFRYSNTDKKCYEIAIECVESGVETHTIYQSVYENSTKSRMRLMGELLTNLHYELDGNLAWFIITQEMMDLAHASKADVEGFTDMVRTIRGVEVALMIVEQNVESCRINFRSKGRFIVNDIAKSLGGGGHALAAGAVVSGSLVDVKEKIVNASIESIRQKMNESL